MVMETLEVGGLLRSSPHSVAGAQPCVLPRTAAEALRAQKSTEHLLCGQILRNKHQAATATRGSGLP